MWIEVKKASSLATAEMWKELFEGEGIPARILSLSEGPRDREIAPYSTLVPKDKEHVIEEVLRKL